MDEQLKRRLIGAIVLVSLAVIFIPMLLDERDASGVHITASNIPPQPPREEPFQSSVLPMPEDEPLIPPVLATGDEEMADDPEVRPMDFSETARTPEPRVGISAWVVQVASLSNKGNAEGLVADLRAKGYSAFLEQISVEGRDLFRIRVGPEIDKKRAERVAEDIFAAVQLKGQVVRYP